VAGIVGVSRNNSRIRGSTASTTDPLAGREYAGGLSLANARRTAFREIPSFLEIALIAIPSDRCNRRISAQSSTVITLHRVTQGVHFQPPTEGQSSPDVDSRNESQLSVTERELTDIDVGLCVEEVKVRRVFRAALLARAPLATLSAPSEARRGSGSSDGRGMR